METPRDTSQIPALSPMARWRQAVASQVLPQAEVNKARSKARLMILQSAMRDWLKKRGHPVPPGKLNPQQKQEIRECFELLDEDGSGALDADELYKAFKMLGMRVTKKSIEKMMNSIDADGTGEIEFDEFQSMMAKTLTSDNSTEAEADGSGTTMMPAGSSLPFQEVARAVRRKKLLDDVMAGGEERLRVMHTFEQMLQDMQGYDAHTVLALRHGHEAASAMTSTALSQSSGKCFEQRPLRVGSLAKTLSLTASHVAALAAETAAADAVTSSRMALPPAVSTFASQRRQLLRSFNSRKLGRSKSGSGLSSFGSGLEIGMPSEAQDQNMEREVAIGLLISQKLGTSHAVPAPRQFKWEVEDGRERAQKWVNEVDEAKIAEGLDRLKSEQSSLLSNPSSSLASTPRHLIRQAGSVSHPWPPLELHEHLLGSSRSLIRGPTLSAQPRLDADNPDAPRGGKQRAYTTYPQPQHAPSNLDAYNLATPRHAKQPGFSQPGPDAYNLAMTGGGGGKQTGHNEPQSRRLQGLGSSGRSGLDASSSAHGPMDICNLATPRYGAYRRASAGRAAAGTAAAGTAAGGLHIRDGSPDDTALETDLGAPTTSHNNSTSQHSSLHPQGPAPIHRLSAHPATVHHSCEPMQDTRIGQNRPSLTDFARGTERRGESSPHQDSASAVEGDSCGQTSNAARVRHRESTSADTGTSGSSSMSLSAQQWNFRGGSSKAQLRQQVDLPLPSPRSAAAPMHLRTRSGKQRSAGMRLLQAGLAGTPAELSDVPPHIAAAQGPAALADSAGDSAAASLKPSEPATSSTSRADLPTQQSSSQWPVAGQPSSQPMRLQLGLAAVSVGKACDSERRRAVTAREGQPGSQPVMQRSRRRAVSSGAGPVQLPALGKCILAARMGSKDPPDHSSANRTHCHKQPPMRHVVKGSALLTSASDAAAAIPRLNLQRALAGQRGLPYREASTAR